MSHLNPEHSLSDPASIAKYHVYSSDGVYEGLVDQMTQRIEVVKRWKIRPGSRILEIGCGQGDCTLALAAAAGIEGHVVGIDPAPLNYGSPYNLGQAHEYIKAGPLGERVTFVQADPIDFLATHPDERYDIAVLAQSSWYFSSTTQLRETLQAAGRVAKRICVSEYALSSTNPTAAAHVLAALTQAALESHKPTSESNIRTVLSPMAFSELATKAGLHLQTQSILVPPTHMYDGSWEVSAVRNQSFVEEVETFVVNTREKAVVLALRDAVIRAWECLPKGTRVATMDIWVAVFARLETLETQDL